MGYFKKTFLTSFILLMSLFFVGKFINTKQFDIILGKILVTSGLNVEFENVNLKNFRDIEVTNLKVLDQNGELIIFAKEAKAKINLLVPARLLKVETYDAVVDLKRKRENYFNVFGILKPDTRTVKANDRASRIGPLYINNAQLNYKDISFNEKIEKKLNNVNGFLEFNKFLGFTLEANGYDGSERFGIKLGDVMKSSKGLSSFFQMKLNNSEENKKFYTNFYFDNVRLNEKFSQYIPLDMINLRDGIINGTLFINNDNFEKNLRVYGDLDFQNGVLSYVDYDGIIKKINGKVHLDDKGINLKGVGSVNNEKIGLDLVFSNENEKLDLDLEVFNMPYELLSKYKILKELPLDIKGKIEGKLHLDYFNKEKKLKINSDFSSNNLELNGYKLEHLKSKMEISENQILTFKETEFNFNHTLNGFNLKKDVKLNKFDYNLSEKKGTGEFLLKNKGSDHNIEEIFGKLGVNENNEIDIDFNSKEIDGKARIDLKDMTVLVNAEGKNYFKAKYNNQNYKLKPNVNDLFIDLKEKEILQSGNINTKVELLDNKLLGELKANVKINKGEFLVDATSRELMGKPFDLKANLVGKSDKFKGNFEIYSPYGEYGLEYENLKIKGEIEDLSTQKFIMDLYAEEIWLGYQRFKDIKGKISLTENLLVVDNIYNDKLNIAGIYNLNDQMMNFDVILQHYILYNVSKPEINIHLDKMEGNIRGNLESLNGKFHISPSKTYLDDEYIGDIQGNIKLKDSILNIENLTLRDNNIDGVYDINKGIMDINVKIKEPKLTQLFKINEFNFGSFMDLKVKGKLDNFNARGNLVLDNVKIRGIVLPNIESDINYKFGDINKLFKYGTLDIEKLSFIDENNEELFSTETSFDLENIDVDYRLENQKFLLDSVKGLKEKGYSGEIDLSFILKGKPEEYFSDIKIKSDKLTLSGFPVEKLDIDTQINNQGIRIGEFYLEYEKNPLLFNGYVAFSPLNYNLSLFAENFNLDFLGLNKDVKNASGIANIDIVFSDIGTEGKILLDNFNYTLKDKSTDVKNLNANVGILNTKLIIERLDGGYNGGIFKVEGDLDVPKIPSDFLTTKKLEVGDFEINASLNNLGIKYGKDIDLVLTGNISLTEDNLYGTLNIDSGEIRNLPSFEENEKISEEERKKILESKTIVESFIEEVIDKVIKQYTVHLNLQAKKDFKLNIGNISLARGIRGDILGETKIHYSDGELNLLGDFSLKKGSFQLNGNKFILNNADVRFTNVNETLENMNPLIDFEASTIINGEKISIGMNGNLKSAEIKLKSDSNLPRNQILSLLAFNTTSGKIEGDENSILDRNNKVKSSEENKVILGSVVDIALNQLLISPVADKIGETFGLTNFSLNTELDKNANLSDGYSGVAKLYAQKDIYKNKLFINGELKFPFQATKSSRNNKEISEALGYNFWINYDFIQGIGFKIGGETIRVVEKNKEKLYNKDDSNYRKSYSDKINYYVGIDLSQRAKTFSELIKKIFYKKKLETLTKKNRRKDEK